MTDDPILRQSLSVRKPYTDPLNYLQAELLKRYRSSDTISPDLERALKVTMAGIADAAEAIEMRTLGMRIALESLVNEAPTPFIVPWRQKHFVVVYKTSKDNSRRFFFFIDGGLVL